MSGTLHTQLYSGQGYIYVCGPSGVFPASDYERQVYDFPFEGIHNLPHMRGAVELWSTRCKPALTSARASFTLQIVSAALGTIDAIDIDSVAQIAAPVAVTVGDEAATAIDVAAAITAHTPVSGPRFSARAVGDTVIGTAVDPGAGPNGLVVAATVTGLTSLSYTSVVAGGIDEGSENVRFLLDVSPGATATVPTSAAEDITKWLSIKGVASAYDTQSAAITGTSIVIERQARDMDVIVTGTGSVDTIVMEGAIDGDRVTLVGDASGSKSIASGGNIVKATAGSTSITNPVNRVTLAYRVASDEWVEVSRAVSLSAAEARASGIPGPLQPGVFLMGAGNGTATITPGATGTSAFPGVVYEHNVALSAGAALGAAMNFTVSTTSALPGDTGIISGNGRAVTGNVITFSDNTGLKATLSTELAASGLWTAVWIVNSVGGSLRVSFSIVPEFSEAAAGFLKTGWYKDGSVTDAKIVGMDGSKLTAGTVPETALDATSQAKLNALAWTYVNVAGNHVATDRQCVNIDSTAANRTVTLPLPGAGSGYQAIRVRKVDASGNTVTLDAGANTIDGSGTYPLAAQYENVLVEWNGSEWFIAT